MGRYFGKENWGEDGKVLQEWTGIMGYTKDGQGIIGEAPGQEGLWICAGFNGHGRWIQLTQPIYFTSEMDGTNVS